MELLGVQRPKPDPESCFPEKSQYVREVHTIPKSQSHLGALFRGSSAMLNPATQGHSQASQGAVPPGAWAWRGTWDPRTQWCQASDRQAS